MTLWSFRVIRSFFPALTLPVVFLGDLWSAGIGGVVPEVLGCLFCEFFSFRAFSLKMVNFSQLS